MVTLTLYKKYVSAKIRQSHVFNYSTIYQRANDANDVNACCEIIAEKISFYVIDLA